MQVPTATPSSQGVDPGAINRLVGAVEAHRGIEPHGLIIQRHGRRIAEAHWAPHRPGRPRLVYSLSKSFTSAALGLQVGEGRLGLDDLVSEHLPDLLADADPLTARMRIRHLASMGTGHDHEMLLDALVLEPDDVVRGFFRIPPAQEPGTVFAYSQPPVLALATILQRLAGEPLSEYLRPRLLDPLGIGRFEWAEHAPGIEFGFSGVFTDLEAIARLGQLHLDDGMWDGRRILPEGWVAQAGSVQTPNPNETDPDWRQGYGFGMWMSQHGFRGDGAFGQYMLVLPEHDVVVAFFSTTAAMQDFMDLVWDHLLPGLDEEVRAGGGSDLALGERLATTALLPSAERRGGVASPLPGGTFVPAAQGPMAHRTVTSVELVAPGPDASAGDELGVIRLAEGEDVLEVVVRADWPEDDDASGLTDPAPVAATASTSADGVVTIDLVFLETPHRMRVRVDRHAGTFVADWVGVPLFGVGIGSRLSRIGVPSREGS